MYEVICPGCGNVIEIDGSFTKIGCRRCGTTFTISTISKYDPYLRPEDYDDMQRREW